MKIFIYLQKFIPRGIPPNLITLIGFMAIIIGIFFTFILDPYLNNSPFFLKIINIICLIIYILADGIDGIHARNTNQTSALGALLDHGVDSVGCLFAVLSTISLLKLGFVYEFFFTFLNIFLIFYLSALEQKKYRNI